MRTIRVLLAAFLVLLTITAEARTVRVLAIGNSFSEDAVESHLSDIARANNDTIIVGNLVIGGCSLQRHWRNAEADAPAYSYRKIGADGVKTVRERVRLSTGLIDEEWDYIVFQQLSSDAGKPETYKPYLPNLIDYIHKALISAKPTLALHQTWAYAVHSKHPGFAYYDRNQMQMYRAIVNAVDQVAKDMGIEMIIPSGTAIQNARSSVIGHNLTLDGHHLSKGIGRYVVACTWYQMLFQQSVIGNRFRPEGIPVYEVEAAQRAADEAVSGV